MVIKKRVLKNLSPALFTILCFFSSQAQKAGPHPVLSSDSLSASSPADKNFIPARNDFPVKSFILPAGMFIYGLTALISDPVEDVNEYFQKKIWIDNPHAKCHVDNYLQFAPGAAVYVLNIAGVKGKHNLADRSLIYFISNVFLNVTVQSFKNFTNEFRPDRSDYSSFPSGHTAEAFASAEFLRQEYKDVSQWYGVAGYATAAATGILRIYNNKHWASDVLSGAAVGIASAKLAYCIYPAVRSLFKKKNAQAMLFPYYQNNVIGLSAVYRFR